MAAPLRGNAVINKLNRTLLWLPICLYGTAAHAQASAQESVLYTFQGAGPTGLGTDALAPISGLVVGSDGNLYGTTREGGSQANAVTGSAGGGTVYTITPSGAESVLYSFPANATDGWLPYAPLVLASDGNFYGTTYSGGAHGGSNGGYGTIFRITPAGAYTQLYSFGAAASDPINPMFALTEGGDGYLYGVTANGGARGAGAVFKISKAGAYSLVYSFDSAPYAAGGTVPSGPLVLAPDGNLYGLTQRGGAYGTGTVYQISSGGAEAVIASFGGCVPDPFFPSGALTVGGDGNLYGITAFVGPESNDSGIAYVVTLSGIIRSIYRFAPPKAGANFNQDVQGGLLLGSDGNFYGLTTRGGDFGTDGSGTAYMLTPGGAYTLLHSFGGNNDGSGPAGLLAQTSDGTFFGITGQVPGTVFTLNVSGAPQAVYSDVTIGTCEQLRNEERHSGGLDLRTLLLLYLPILWRWRERVRSH